MKSSIYLLFALITSPIIGYGNSDISSLPLNHMHPTNAPYTITYTYKYYSVNPNQNILVKKKEDSTSSLPASIEPLIAKSSPLLPVQSPLKSSLEQKPITPLSKLSLPTEEEKKSTSWFNKERWAYVGKQALKGAFLGILTNITSSVVFRIFTYNEASNECPFNVNYCGQGITWHGLYAFSVCFSALNALQSAIMAAYDNQ